MGHQALRDRIPSFDIRHSIFFGSAVRCLYPSFDPPAAVFNPQPLNPIYSFLQTLSSNSERIFQHSVRPG